MAENIAEENTAPMEIKLMIDPMSKKLIFAEASKDFVDFLFVLLSLPIGTAIKLLTTESTLGSISNIYASVTNLDQTYLQPNIHKNELLNPMVFSPVNNIQLSITGSSVSDKLYTCLNKYCTNFTDISNGPICPCGDPTTKEIKVSGVRCIFIKKFDKKTKGYVKDKVSYMIHDDLSVTPITTICIVSMMKKFNVSELEERKVKVGPEKALELLKTSFKSITVLTDVFLKK